VKKQFLAVLICFVLVSSMMPGVYASDGGQKVHPLKPVIKDDLENLWYDGVLILNVTLITGDIVVVSELPDGNRSFAIIPVDPTELGQNFQIFETPDGTYVIPSDVDLEKLDVELFNIDYLIKEGYHEMASLPVIITSTVYVTGEDVGGVVGSRDVKSTHIEKSARTLQSIETKIKKSNGKVTMKSPRLSMVAAELPVDTIKDLTPTLLEQPDVKKIWLDRKVHVSLNESVPLIGAPELWEMGYNGSGIQIAILDTGINAVHPDLDDLDDDPNTADPKVIRAIDFTDDGSTDDFYGHGTHCAGIAAGTGEVSNYTYIGVAPGAYLWNVKVLNRYGYGYESWIISGIEYAAYGLDSISNTGDEADIISMSLGGPGTDGTDPMSIAVDAAVEAGVTVVIAAGNDYDYMTIGTPGVARKVITVGATDKYDDLASFSSKGPTVDFRVKPDVVAPGVYITAPLARGSYLEELYEEGIIPGEDTDGDGYADYISIDGTSMSTPHVAGAAALMLQVTYQTLHIDWSPPKYVKNALISTAVDLGYNVYEQGGGRIDIPSAMHTDILVDPATTSFGLYSGDSLDSTMLTFYNLNTTSNRTLTLNVSVYDIITDTYVDCADLSTNVLTIAPNSDASVLLTINTTVPKSIYSGKVVADVDTNETVCSIFGFARLNKVKITKLDMDGVFAAYEPVMIFEANGTYFWWGYTDENGTITFYTPDGTFYVLSHGYDLSTQSTIWTIADKLMVSGNVAVTLDERQTVPITLDMNKPGQIISGKQSSINYLFDEWWSLSWTSLWWYPTTSTTRISFTTLNVTTEYEYYPEEYFKPTNPEVIDTPEWHKLLYAELGITGPLHYVVDYDTLVKKSTDYRVGMTPKVAAQYVQFAFPMSFPKYSAWAFGWAMNLPQSRDEYLSPDTRYDGFIEKWLDRPWVDTPYWLLFDWDYHVYEESERLNDVWNGHPFSTNFRVEHYNETFGNQTFTELDMFGTFFMDAYGHSLLTSSPWWGEWKENNWMTIIRNGNITYNGSEWDAFWHSFNDEPATYQVIMDGYSGQYLSTTSHTELKFAFVNEVQDYAPPTIYTRVQGINMDGTHDPGDVKIDVVIDDQSPISNVTFDYSVDNGTTWTAAPVVQQPDDTYQADLGVLEDVYVSLRINATDSVGNSISQTTIKGFYVGAIPEYEPTPSRAYNEITLTPSETSYALIGQDLKISNCTANGTLTIIGENGTPTEGVVYVVPIDATGITYFDTAVVTIAGVYTMSDGAITDHTLFMINPILTIDLKLNGTTTSVSNVTAGQIVDVKVTTNLNDADVATIKLVDPDGNQWMVDGEGKNLRDIPISTIRGFSLNTTGFILGTWTVTVKTNASAAQGLDLSSNTVSLGIVWGEGTTITIASGTAPPNENVTVPIMINNVTDVGVADITLTYNSSVVHVTTVDNSDFDVMIPVIDNTTGIVRIGTFQGLNPGLTGDVKLADVTLKAVGNIDESSVLGLSIIELKTVPGVEIPATVDNGTFAVEEITPPSVTSPSANPASIPDDTDNDPRWGETSQLNVTVTDESGVTSVTINLSAIGGLPAQPMNRITDTNIWTITINASKGTAGTHDGTHYLPYCLNVNATDIYGNSNISVCVNLTVINNGDVNEDGSTTLYDAMYLAKYVLDKPGFEIINEGVAEVSGDDSVSLYDAMYLAKYVLGKPGFEVLH